MDKAVKDVFKNCAREENKFNLATVKEVKFSKKLNAVILDSFSEESIPLADIEEFERYAKKKYELSSFKINYSYLGKQKDIDIQNVYDTITNLNKKYEYTQDIFENCKINIDNNELTVIEVKSTNENAKALKEILNNKNKYNVHNNFKLANTNIGDANGINTIPLYMAFLIK